MRGALRLRRDRIRLRGGRTRRYAGREGGRLLARPVPPHDMPLDPALHPADGGRRRWRGASQPRRHRRGPRRQDAVRQVQGMPLERRVRLQHDGGHLARARDRPRRRLRARAGPAGAPREDGGVDPDHPRGAGAVGLHTLFPRPAQAAALLSRGRPRVLRDGLLHRDGRSPLPHDEGEGPPPLRRREKVRRPPRLRLRPRAEAHVAQRTPRPRVRALPPRRRGERGGRRWEGRQVRAARAALHPRPTRRRREQRRMERGLPPGGAPGGGDEGRHRPRSARDVLLHRDVCPRLAPRRQ